MSHGKSLSRSQSLTVGPESESGVLNFLTLKWESESHKKQGLRSPVHQAV